MIGILGGGLAGLSAAYHLKEDGLVLERETTAGGLCRSRNINGFTFDYGPHIFYTKNSYVKSLLDGLLAKQGNRFLEKPRQAFVYLDGAYVKYPFEANLYALPEKIRSECIRGVKQRPSSKPANFGEWIDVTFGKGIARHYMRPYNRKIWKYPLEKMDLEWIAGRVPAPDLNDIVSGAGRKTEYGPNVVFYYPDFGGTGAIAGCLESEVRNKIRYNLGVTEIKFVKDGLKVACGEKQFEFDKLISTLPLPELVSTMDAPSDVSSAARKLVHNSLVCVNLGLDRPRVSDKHWLYFPEKKFIFSRISFPGNFSAKTVPKGKSSILTEITLMGKKKDDAFYVERVTDCLVEADILRKNEDMLVADVNYFKYAYAIYDLERRRNLEVIRNFLESRNIISIGRFGGWEYLNMDASILAGKAAAEALRVAD